MGEGRIYVRVTGNKVPRKELEIYFQSRKQSGGGDISSIKQLNDEEYIITFEDQESKFLTYVFLSIVFNLLFYSNKIHIFARYWQLLLIIRCKLVKHENR